MAVTEDEYLRNIEQAHQHRAGARNFCYIAMRWTDNNLWRISVTATDLDGHIPISEDWFMGDESEMTEVAARLNQDRLGLSRKEAAIIVATSLGNSHAQRRRA